MAAGSTFHASAANGWETGNFIATSNQVNAADSNSNDFKLAICQIGLGTVKTEFEIRSPQEIFADTSRYFQRIVFNSSSAVGIARVNTTASATVVYPYPVSMRVTPSTATSGATDWILLHSGGNVTSTAMTFSNQNTYNMLILISVSGTPLTVDEAVLISSLVSNKFIEMDARFS